ncbi:MAG: glutamine--fructose-6-phosphate aminotransferase [Candidatus Tectomicrobia bacterium RIFCSPLOWO2_12_FULL_69_37]|nr:MAG: glutamine--fructose-6-phosphate aminotransferase [Candidatus Tectomicrobia bacterium RIFCSPLOWO2_02_FULL_70_19]OGL69374.1 MAG: glutamine--fructose-6-phosphate aminotransferase [Candidatus Tectomicrobia bacterium RIFCSPLOWO2_12_FULL_69_37]
MCGIAGVAGSTNIAQRLFRGIAALEYRGYDSCGMAVQRNGTLDIRKNIGTVESVNQNERLTDMKGLVGIAHTRWATHGGVTRENAHPHSDNNGRVAVVHNGIISNYRDIRERLGKAGAVFRSETDTEVIAHLIAHHLKQGAGEFERAFVAALRELEGTFALAVISVDAPGVIFCCKRESPLIIGLGDDANYVGSDFNAFIEYTRQAVILEDGEYAVVTRQSYAVKNLRTEEPVPKEVTEIEWDVEMARRGGYPHYMLKEIYDQPATVQAALRIPRSDLAGVARMIHGSRLAFLGGVGTTYYMAAMGQYFFSRFSGRYLPAVSTDELPHLADMGPEDCLVAISQSGETYDTLTAVRHAKRQGAKTAAIVNVMGSSLVRAVDLPILQGSGPEICVISTKAAMSQAVLLLLSSLELGRLSGSLEEAEVLLLRDEVASLGDRIAETLNERSGFLHTAARQHQRMKNWLYLGRGIYYPAALECALKMKEVTYLHAEGMSAGFLKHGTISLIDENMYTIVLMPAPEEKELHALTRSSAEEVRARGGFVLGFRFEGDEASQGLFSEEIVLPRVSSLLAPFLHLVAGQLFAYFLAVALKRDVDRPRALAKSVTVA